MASDMVEAGIVPGPEFHDLVERPQCQVVSLLPPVDSDHAHQGKRLPLDRQGTSVVRQGPFVVALARVGISSDGKREGARLYTDGLAEIFDGSVGFACMLITSATPCIRSCEARSSLRVFGDVRRTRLDYVSRAANERAVAGCLWPLGRLGVRADSEQCGDQAEGCDPTQCEEPSSDFTMFSHITLASANSIIVLSRKNSSLSTPA